MMNGKLEELGSEPGAAKAQAREINSKSPAISTSHVDQKGRSAIRIQSMAYQSVRKILS